MGYKTNIGSCGHFLRFIFIALNILFSLVGLGLIAVGIYLVVTGGTYAFITGNEYASGAPILMVCGFVTFIIAVVGLVAGIFLWWPLFLIYAVILLIVVILEVAAGILGFVFRDNLATFYSDRFNETIFSYRNVSGSAENTFVDIVQTNFQCCGVEQPSDWMDTSFFNTERRFPQSCSSGCNDTGANCIIIDGQLVHSTGCNGSFFQFVVDNAATIGGVGLSFGLIEVVGVILAFTLCACVFAKRNSDDGYSMK